jgi:hypothetical protein
VVVKNDAAEIATLGGLGRHTKVNRCITEGRRAFIARYARIEGGDECERWLPLLSAIVDGEATPDQLIEVRPHLRHCSACRATVRQLHAGSAPLAALLPVALAPDAAGEHVHAPAAGVLVRLYEAVVNGVHERAASAAFKLQAAAEAASGGKLAAIAASAAAIAGGGAVVVNGSAATHHQTVQHTRPVAQRAAVGPTAAPPRLARVHATTTPAPAERAARRAPRREFTRRHTTSVAHTEFTSAATTSSEPIAAPPAPTGTVLRSGSPEPSASGHEFASEFGG